jgi:hypothetical protein
MSFGSGCTKDFDDQYQSQRPYSVNSGLFCRKFSAT